MTNAKLKQEVEAEEDWNRSSKLSHDAYDTGGSVRVRYCVIHVVYIYNCTFVNVLRQIYLFFSS